MTPAEFLHRVSPPGGRCRLEDDSRRLRAGDVFCAYPGTRDGRDHVPDALRRAVAGVLWERDGGPPATVFASTPNLPVAGLRDRLGAIAAAHYGNPSRQVKVVAVTGTKGKTTVATWIARLAGTVGMPGGSVGTLGAWAGATQVDVATLTTPGPLQLHRLLATLARHGCQVVGLEASSHGLRQRRLAEVDCAVAVFTNLGTDHLDYHGSHDAYRDAKRLLFTRPELQGAVINVDDPAGRDFAASCSSSVLAVGEGASTDLRWEAGATGPTGTQARLHHAGESLALLVPVPGRHNVANAALAVGALLGLGVGWPRLREVLARPGCLGQVPGRLQRVGPAGGAVAGYVDYAHTPEALAAALATVRAAHPGGRLHCVFGCGGNRDVTKRPLMGEVAGRLADRVVITNDNPRDEDPMAIASAVAAGATGGVSIELDRATAIAAAVAAAAPGDVVLVAGKGHETTIDFGNGNVVAFDDAACLATALDGPGVS